MTATPDTPFIGHTHLFGTKALRQFLRPRQNCLVQTIRTAPKNREFPKNIRGQTAR